MLSACGGFLSSQKSVAHCYNLFCPNAPSPPHKKMPPRRSPYRLVHSANKPHFATRVLGRAALGTRCACSRMEVFDIGHRNFPLEFGNSAQSMWAILLLWWWAAHSIHIHPFEHPWRAGILYVWPQFTTQFLNIKNFVKNQVSLL